MKAVGERPGAAAPADGVSLARISRRAFLLSGAGVAVAVAFGGLAGAGKAKAQASAYRPTAWVRVAADGTVTILAPASEMGQGVMTALPLLLAEEMDLDWERVRVEQAPSDPAAFGNPLFGGALTTGASRSTQGYYDVMRIAGLQARYVLMATAAKIWGVHVLEIDTEPHTVVHLNSGRKMHYGEVALLAEVPAGLPHFGPEHLKPASRFRLIGKDVPRVDVPDKVSGRAQFGIDVRFPRMLYATVLRAPVQGETLDKIDDTAARRVAGVRAVVQLPYGVGVIAESYWTARKARAALRGQWSQRAKARAYTSDKILAEYRARARNLADPGVEYERIGDPETAFGAAAKTLRAEYASEHVAHVCMEPMNCTARVDGDRIEIWAPTQSPSLLVSVVSQAAGFKPENIVCHVSLLGGGFGRRIDADYAIDAALLAKAVPGVPVKVVWAREDDIQNDKFRPLAAQHLSAALDARGNLVALRHRIVAESIYARVAPAQLEQSGGRDGSVNEGAYQLKYAIPNRILHYLREQRGVDVGFWRGVGAGYTKFAIESFVDELAAAGGRDPVAYRLALLANEPRGRAVIEEAARMAQWEKKRPRGRALGIAYSDTWNSHVAEVVEVSVDRERGRISVHDVWCAVDCGVALQPKNVTAQIESGVMLGISQALRERVVFKDGRPLHSNYHNYPVLRIEDAPRVQIKVLSTGHRPGGVGEVGLPPVAPAIANAVAALSGKRLRRLPLEQELLRG
jgi:isoquinoline 1-oxidoreductase beta subunit